MSAPNLIAAVIQKIHQHVQARCWSELVLLCENILPHFPDKVLIYQYLGLAQRELRAYQSAEKALKTALRLSPENISTLNHLGRLYQRQQAPQTALEYFERALHLLPPGHQAAPRIHFNQALCWLALGQYQKGFLAYLEKRRTGDDPSAPKQITYYQGEELQGKTL